MFGLNPSQFTSTRWIIHHEFSTFTPESFNITQKCLKEESSPSPCVAAVISVLRLAHFDTDVFMKFKQVLIENKRIVCNYFVCLSVATVGKSIT